MQECVRVWQATIIKSRAPQERAAPSKPLCVACVDCGAAHTVAAGDEDGGVTLYSIALKDGTLAGAAAHSALGQRKFKRVGSLKRAEGQWLVCDDQQGAVGESLG